MNNNIEYLDKFQFVEILPFNDNHMLSLNSLVDMFPHTDRLS